MYRIDLPALHLPMNVGSLEIMPAVFWYPFWRCFVRVPHAQRLKMRSICLLRAALPKVTTTNRGALPVDPQARAWPHEVSRAHQLAATGSPARGIPSSKALPIRT